MRARGDDHGSLSTELAVSVPIILVLFILIMVANRGVTARMDVESVAEAAARAASLQRDPQDADSAATEAALATLGDGRITCSPLSVEVDTSGFTAGGRVTAHVHCGVHYSDLAMGFPLPGQVTVTGQATSPIDTWRGDTP